MYRFRWNDWNIAHIAEHGVTPFEAEYVVQRARRPYPRYRGDEKWLVWGQTWDGGWLQVVYVFDSDEAVYVIHSRPLTESEKRQVRRNKR